MATSILRGDCALTQGKQTSQLAGKEDRITAKVETVYLQRAPINLRKQKYFKEILYLFPHL